MKLKELINNENFLSKYGDYEIVRDTYTTVRKNDKLQLMFDIQKPKPKTILDLKIGFDTYYYVDESGDVGISTWYDWDCDKERFNIGNAFLTEEEAEKDTERRKVEALLLKYGGRRWFDGHNHNFHIGLDEYEEHLKAYILMTPTQGTIYFDTSARAQKAISEIGEERIKEALFEVR